MQKKFTSLNTLPSLTQKNKTWTQFFGGRKRGGWGGKHSLAGGFNPIWIILVKFGENKNYLKPPPRCCHNPRSQKKFPLRFARDLFLQELRFRPAELDVQRHAAQHGGIQVLCGKKMDIKKGLGDWWEQFLYPIGSMGPVYFPTCQVRVVRFYVSLLFSFSSSSSPPSSSSSINWDPLSSVWRAGPQWQLGSSEFSVACRTTTAIRWVQCGVLDPNRDPMSSVWRAGPQPRCCEFSVACWTPTAILRVQCGVLDPRKSGQRSSCKMSQDKSDRVSADMFARRSEKMCQREWSKICQECQKRMFG